MSIALKWHTPDRKIILWEFIGNWEWRDYHTAINQAVVMLKSVDHTVDSIIDVSQSTAFPPDMLIQGRRWFQVAPANFGITVVTGTNNLLKGIALTIGRILPLFIERILVADTVEEAEKIILSKRQSHSGSKS